MKAIATIATLFALVLAGPAPAADPARPDTFDSAGVSIAYLVAGKGEPVVLIHGLYSSAGINWQLPGTVKLLAEHYQVIALDLRGHGRSGKPKEEDAYGPQMAEDVIRLMDHLKIEKAHIVGYSLGGIIALKVIADHPDRVLSGTLGGMGWLREGSGLQELWERLPGREGAGLVPPACVRSIGKLGLSEEAVRGIKVPVAVLVGDRDPCKKLYVEPLTRVRKDWPVTEIEGAGHLNCILKEQFKDELKKWLDKNARP
jgi:pimeloyl-ACP methyl ester carboxylesterase